MWHNSAHGGRVTTLLVLDVRRTCRCRDFMFECRVEKAGRCLRSCKTRRFVQSLE
jgi:hypothetical protein